MSRNKEKAQSLLNLYYAQKGPQIPTQRPKYTGKANSVKDAELFRKMCLQDINKNLMKINNPIIGEYEIRDLNSKLNKLFREKRSWEHRIKDLGGPDYLQVATIANTDENNGATIIKGYRYFGRAKELPDVQKLLKSSKEESAERTKDFKKKKYRDEASKRLNNLALDAEYYGLLDEPKTLGGTIIDGELGIPSEQELLDEVKSTLGEKSLPKSIITPQELKYSLNPQRSRNEKGNNIISHERLYTRSASRRHKEESEPKFIIPTDALISDNLDIDRKVEEMVVNQKKKELLEKIVDI